MPKRKETPSRPDAQTPGFRAQKTGWALGAVAIAYLALSAWIASSYGWNASCFLHVGDANNPAERAGLPSGLVVYKGSSGYDGLHYYQVARDPLRRDASRAAAFKTKHFLTRYQRIGYPAAAWAAAAGREPLLPAAMLAANLAAALACAWAFLLLGSPPWALAAASAPALSIGVCYGLTEPLALALAAWGIFCFQRGSAPRAAFFLAAACLARETSALFAIAFALDQLLRRRAKDAAWLLGSMLPAAAYAVWLRHDLDAGPSSAFTDGLGFPFLGFLRQLDLDLGPAGGERAAAAAVWLAFAWCAASGHAAARSLSHAAPWRGLALAVGLHSVVVLCSYQEAWATFVNAGRLAGGLSLSLLALAASPGAPCWSRGLALAALPLHAAALLRILADRGLPYTLS